MNRQLWIWPLLLVLLGLLFVASLALGSVEVGWESWQALFAGERSSRDSLILLEIRLPRAVSAMAAGAGLGIAGLLMQTLFRNPLAGPGILGITSGAGLGVAAVMLSGAGSATLAALRSVQIGEVWTILLAAALGAGLVMGIVLLLSWRIKDPVVLLVVGVMVGQMTMAVVSVWQYLSQPEEIREYLLWSFGSFSGVTPGQSLILLGIVVVTGGLAMLGTKTWNLLLLGESYAQSLGLSVNRARVLLIATTSVLTGAVTALCGPIGFIGVAVPHLARGLTGRASHGTLLPATALAGAALMLLCDLIARLPGASGSIPLNAVTILIGAPVVVAVLLNRSRYRGMW